MSEFVESKVFMEDLALDLRRERKLRGLSQSELAEFSGVSLNFVSQLESGKSTARIDKILVVLQALGMSLKLIYKEKKRI